MDDTAPMDTPVSEADVYKAIKEHSAHAEKHYEKLMKKMGDKAMTEFVNLDRGNNDGLLGGGMIGGLVLGSLLRNNGNLFGNNGTDGFVNGNAQPQANMSIMAGIGDLKQAVAVGTANLETSNAVQSAAIQGQLSAVAAALSANLNGVKDAANQNAVALMQQLNGVQQSVDKNAWAVTTAVSNDGDKTRALITQQYEATLNRQLSDANAAIIELRSDQRFAERSRGVEVTTTNNINQAQAQQQQQLQFQDIRRLVGDLANDLQYIRATNQAINIGAGTQTANPTNTNTNVKA